MPRNRRRQRARAHLQPCRAPWAALRTHRPLAVHPAPFWAPSRGGGDRLHCVSALLALGTLDVMSRILSWTCIWVCVGFSVCPCVCARVQGCAGCITPLSPCPTFHDGDVNGSPAGAGHAAQPGAVRDGRAAPARHQPCPGDRTGTVRARGLDPARPRRGHLLLPSNTSLQDAL